MPCYWMPRGPAAYFERDASGCRPAPEAGGLRMDVAPREREVAPRRRIGLALTASLGMAALGLSTAALAHHGFGRFDRSKQVELTGVITSIDFVNPHSYLHFDVVDSGGQKIVMRCEMRAATLLRRSGWSAEMFVVGAPVTVFGFAHRDDPASCYLEDVKIGDAPGFNRNDQFETTSLVDVSKRPLRRPSGEPNISG
jgi:hypothetical protein